MRFGLFIPQGWRFDLTEVAPEQHWETMLSLLHYADNAAAGEAVPGGEFAWESVWVYDHFQNHTPPHSGQATRLIASGRFALAA